MLVGFIHGVMNTDNMSIAGETIDYGPCAFMDEYDPGKVFSSIDRQGRYAYGNQPQIATWNLSRFAETLLPLIDEGQQQAVQRAEDVLKGFSARFDAAYLAGMRHKLGLSTVEVDDLKLVDEFLSLLAADGADLTLAFRRLSDAAGEGASEQPLRSSFMINGFLMHGPRDGASAWRGAGRPRKSSRQNARGQSCIHPT